MNSYSNNIKKIIEAYEVQDFLTGKVSFISTNYLIVKVLDYPCIMPKEEVELFSIRDYQKYLNKEVVVKVISIKQNDLKGFDIKVSHRTVSEEILLSNKVESFDDTRKNFTYKGIVKDIKDFGVFVTLGNIDGLIHISQLPEAFAETPDNYLEIGSVIDVKVISKNIEKRQISLSIPSVETSSTCETELQKHPFELFKNELIPNKTILQGRVVYLEKDCVTLHVLHRENKFTVYIKKDDLAWEKVQNAADVVFLGEELRIRYLAYENNKLYFDLKWQQEDIYPEELFTLETDDLLTRLNVSENKFHAKINIIYNRNSEGENKEISGAFANNIIAADPSDNCTLLVDKYTGNDIIAYVPSRYAYGLENGKYYTFVLTAATTTKRKEEHRPFMFTAQLDSAIPLSDPFKDQVEKSFKENKTPKSNREAANYLKEIGADMYTDRDRMFYELLQNADDSSSARGVKVMVQIKDHFLIFTHDGLSFSKQDFKSIVSTANSTKKLDRKKTGYKGIGFKSVFTDSEKVYIKTGGFFFVFDKKAELFNDFHAFYKYVNPIYTEEQLDTFFEDYSEYEKDFEGVDHLPWQLLPFWVDKIPEELKGTTFSRNCNVAIALDLGASTEKYKGIIKGIIQKPRFMLFLRNTKRIQFEDKKWNILSITKHTNKSTNIVTLKNSFAFDEKEISYIVHEWNEVPITNEAFEISCIPMYKECHEIAGREKWTMYQLVDGIKVPLTSIPERIIASDTTSLSYAFMLDDNGCATRISDKTPSLYAYLPMEDRRYMFPFYINGDFELSSNRQEAKRVSVWNEYLFYNIGKHIISWVATLASQSHPTYLYLLPQDYFAEELEEGKIDRLAAQFNRGYNEALYNTAFILDDKLELAPQSKIAIDESGFANIIGADDYRTLMGIDKHLPHCNVDITPLANDTIFSEIEHIQNSTVIYRILSKEARIKLIRYWFKLSDDLRKAILIHIAGLSKNKKNLDAHLLEIPAYKSSKGLWSFNKLLKSKTVILRTHAIEGIEDILESIGFTITDEHESDHPFHSKLEENISAYTLHIFDIIAARTADNSYILNTNDKIKLFTCFTSNKLAIPHEAICRWAIFRNMEGVTKPLSELIHIDGSLYCNITNKYAIDDEEYKACPRLIDRFLMKEKEQFDKIVLSDWDTLVTKVSDTEENARALYRFVAATYIMAEHEQAITKGTPIWDSKKFVFANKLMYRSSDVLLSTGIANSEEAKHVVETITGKVVPSPDIINNILGEPFCYQEQCLETVKLLENKTLTKEDVEKLLDYCLYSKDTVFKNYYLIVQEGEYIFKELPKEHRIVYTDNAALSKFIKQNCNDLFQLPPELAEYCGLKNILTGEDLLLTIISHVDIMTHAEVLLPFYMESISRVKSAYIEKLSKIDLNAQSFLSEEDVAVQTLKMASTIEKPEESLFYNLRAKIKITYNNTTEALSSIKLQHTIEVDGKKYPLSKLVPNEDKMALLVDTLKERIESYVQQPFINKLFGEEIDEGRANSIFNTLNKPTSILENGTQMAFILNYAQSTKTINNVSCQVYDFSDDTSHTLSKDWIFTEFRFINDEYALSHRYADAVKYLTMPFVNDRFSIRDVIDTFKYVKRNLTEDEIVELLDFVHNKHHANQSFKKDDIALLKTCLSIDEGEYVISDKFSLEKEKLPTVFTKWRFSSDTYRKDVTLKDVLGFFTEDSDVVCVRRFLTEGMPLSISNKNSVLSKLTCNWIREQKLLLNDGQFFVIQNVISNDDFSCERDIEELEKYAVQSCRFMTFADYYVYLCDGKIPWVAKLASSNYVFHRYLEDDVALSGENIYINKNENFAIIDHIRSLINSGGFTADHFLEFFDQYKNKIKGTLEGENDNDADEEERFATSEIARQEAINWLSSQGYDTNNLQTEFNFLNGVKKDDKEYHIVVKSLRNKTNELMINPNEWLYLLKENSRLMLYLGHMRFSVIDREMLLGNHDFLRLRISTSNFSVEEGRLEGTISKLARDIQYFKRTHFIFEHLHDNILTNANSLDDYAFYKSNGDEAFNNADDEEIS